MSKKLFFLMSFVLVLMIAAPVFGDDILAPTDFIIAIDADGGSGSPDNEPVTEAIDLIYGGANQKYLNFGGANSGFIVTPGRGPSIIESFTIWTANDAVHRDPATWQLYGTNAAIASTMHSQGTAESWTLIDSGSLSLPAGRNSTDTGPGGYNQTVAVTSTVRYASYKMLFPTIKGGGNDTYMQIAEVQFYGVFYSPNPRLPNPADLAVNVPLDANITWTTGDGALLEYVYFGTDPCDMDLPLVDTLTVGVDDPLYDPPGDLIPSTTYYWYVVDVNGLNEYKGPLWRFTTIRGEATPKDPRDGDEIDGELYPEDPPYTHIWTMLIFNPGPTAVKHTGYFSEDYSEVYNRVEDANLGQPPFPYPGWSNIFFAGNPDVPPAIETLVRGKTYYWCVDATDIWGNTFPFDPADNIWEFTVLSYYATKPNPPNEAIYIAPDVLLSWRGGYDVDVHDVYFGTNWEDVNNANEFDLTGIYQGWGADPNWQCSGLPTDTKIYWRVDEVHNRTFPGSGTIYKGPVWEFTTRGATPGLTGEYYHHTAGASPEGFESKVLVRIDPDINFDWDYGSPDPSMRVDHFSVRWTGKIAAPHPGETYTFTTETDDGVRLWVDDQLLIDQWINQGVTPYSGTIELGGFGPYDIVMEYYEYTSPAVARLYWQSASTRYGIVPDNFLSPNIEALTAYGPNPLDGSWLLNWEPVLSWGPALLADTHKLYISTDFDDVNERTVTAISLSDPYYNSPRLDLDQTYYWAVDGILLGHPASPWKGDVWSFTIPPGGTGSIIREWWTGISGVTVPDLTGNANYPDYPTGRELINVFEFPPNAGNSWADNYGTRIHGWLRPPTTGDYRFWLATDDGGDLNLSTDEDPANAVRIAWITGWVPPRDWDNLGGTTEPNRVSGWITLEAGKKYYISGLQKEQGGDDNIAAAWQGPSHSPVSVRELISGYYLSPTPHDPPEAYGPYPRNGATNVEDRTPTLSWKPGFHVQKTVGHRLYFSDRFADVNERRPAAYKGALTEPNYPLPPPPLLLDHTYYWAIDEVNSSGPPPYLWKGRVWSFMTAPCMTLDNMEDYNDRGEIKGVWTDGYASVGWGGTYPFKYPLNTATSGSNLHVSTEVGSPSAGVTGPVHGGDQAMVLRYDNDGSTETGIPGEEEWVYDAATFSEVEANTVENLGVGQDWTGEGVKSFTMWFQGHPIADGNWESAATWPELEVTGRGRDIGGGHDEFYFIGLHPWEPGSFASYVEGRVMAMDNTDTLAKAGIMVREKMTPYSRYAAMFVTPTNEIIFQWRDVEGGLTGQAVEQPSVSVPVYLRLDRTSLGAFTASYSVTGESWDWHDVNVSQDPDVPYKEVTMDDPCLHAGFAVTSHNAATLCTADVNNFDADPPDVGSWVWGNIGLNSAEQLYVALEDTVGNISVVEHDDVNAATLDSWQEWNIELTEFSTVNLNAVKKVRIGLGDRDLQPAGGSGALYIDDVRACPPRCVASLIKPLYDIAEPYDCIVDEKDLRVLAGDWLLRDRIITTSAPSDVNLAARYEFEGNWNDTSGNGRHASDPCGTNPGFVTGVIGQALSLDGVDDHLVVEPNVGIDGNTPRTICCWAKADSMNIPNWTLIFGFTTVGGGDNTHFNIGYSADPVILQAEPSFIAHVWGWEEQILPLDVGVWHHFAMTYDGSTIRYYGDGVELDTDPDKSQVRILVHADNVQIGKRATQASCFPGAVDDARIYSVVLSEAEIAHLATQGAPTLHVPIPSPAEVYQGEAEGSQWINLKDYALITGSWLEEMLWPSD